MKTLTYITLLTLFTLQARADHHAGKANAGFKPIFDGISLNPLDRMSERAIA